MRALDVLGAVIVAVAFGIGAQALVRVFLRGLAARNQEKGNEDGKE